jgi:DNA-binding Lrp family transcriptional regulator
MEDILRILEQDGRASEDKIAELTGRSKAEIHSIMNELEESSTY